MPWVAPKKGWYLAVYDDTSVAYFLSGERAGNFWIDEEWEDDGSWTSLLWNCLPDKQELASEYFKRFETKEDLVAATKEPFKSMVSAPLPNAH